MYICNYTDPTKFVSPSELNGRPLSKRESAFAKYSVCTMYIAQFYNTRGVHCPLYVLSDFLNIRHEIIQEYLTCWFKMNFFLSHRQIQEGS